jgi:hypothetical protein
VEGSFSINCFQMKSTPASQVGDALKKQMPSHLVLVHKFAVYLFPSLYYSLFANTTHPGKAIRRFYNPRSRGTGFH